MEEWKDIDGYEGLYRISNLGNVSHYTKKSGWTNKKLTLGTTGYLKVQLWKNNKSKTVNVHRLVAKAFIDNPSNLPFINHIDEDKTNNKVSNLEWCTHEYNCEYGTAKERSAFKRRKAIICIDTGDIFSCAREASEKYNISRQGIASCCKGDRKTCGGYHWEYIQGERISLKEDN